MKLECECAIKLLRVLDGLDVPLSSQVKLPAVFDSTGKTLEKANHKIDGLSIYCREKTVELDPDLHNNSMTFKKDGEEYCLNLGWILDFARIGADKVLWDTPKDKNAIVDGEIK